MEGWRGGRRHSGNQIVQHLHLDLLRKKQQNLQLVPGATAEDEDERMRSSEVGQRARDGERNQACRTWTWSWTGLCPHWRQLRTSVPVVGVAGGVVMWRMDLLANS